MMREADLDDDEGAFFLSKEIGSGEGVSGTPLAYMKFGVVPCLASNNKRISLCGRIQSGRRRGAAVHSTSPSAAESHQWLYLGSW